MSSVSCDAWIGLPYQHHALGPAFTSSVIDATGEKFAWIGQVYYRGAASTKDISRVGFLFGTVTKAGGSAMTVSLQNVTSGIAPDETQDQTVAIANADAGFVSNAWYRTDALSADRTVARGEWLAVVIEYDGGGRLSSDVVNLRNEANANGRHIANNVGVGHKVGGSWAGVGVTPNIILEFDDGTFGTLSGATPCSNVSNQFIDSAQTPDEVGMAFTNPFPSVLDRVVFALRLENSSSAFDLVLEDENDNIIFTVSNDPTFYAGVENNNHRYYDVPLPETVLQAGLKYYLSLRSADTDGLDLWNYNVADANHWQAHTPSTPYFWAQRTNDGAWTETTTRRPMMALHLTALDDGVGGGGGMIVHPGMSGGMRG